LSFPVVSVVIDAILEIIAELSSRQFPMLFVSCCRGSFAVVRVATHNKTKVKYAVKEVYTGDLTNEQLADLDKEMCILSQLRHNNICGLHEIYKAPNHVYMVSIWNECILSAIFYE
jgi:serine/threonine protein kinase